MAELTKEELMGVAGRAMLEITDEEAEVYTNELLEILGRAEELNELDTESVVPMTHALQLVNVMREDIVADVLDREKMLAGVKEHKAGEIKVPAIL